LWMNVLIQLNGLTYDNGTEYKGTNNHAFVSFLRNQKIGQKFTKTKRPQTNVKA
jgi:hypothetical protein